MPTDAKTKRCLTEALAKRAALMADPSTNAFRLIDGEGDQLPGLTVDVFDDVWLLSTKGTHFPDYFRTANPHAATLYWKRLQQNQKEPPTLLWGPIKSAPFAIREESLQFEVSMQAGYSQGIFLDQRENRTRIRQRSQAGDRILNTFSYTCAFSIAAAKADAVTTSLDLSKNYLEWGKRNFVANELDPADHYFCRGDALQWMQRFAKQQRFFRGVILDPPTFSRSDASVFQAQKHYDQLVAAALAITEAGGWLLATCNDRKLSHQAFEDLIRHGIETSRRQIAKLRHTKMPSDFTGEPYLKSVWLDLHP